MCVCPSGPGRSAVRRAIDGANAPEANVPEAKAPEANAPEANAPEATRPRPTRPRQCARGNAPEADVPEADVPTLARRRKAYSLRLDRGLPDRTSAYERHCRYAKPFRSCTCHVHLHLPSRLEVPWTSERSPNQGKSRWQRTDHT